MDIPAAISAVTAAIGLAKELNSIDVQLDQAGLKLKIAELTSALAETKLGLVDLAEQINARDKKIAELTDGLKYRVDQLIEYRGFRYRAINGKPAGRPFCPVCDQLGFLVQLAQDRTKAGFPETCPRCKGSFGHVSVFRYPESEAKVE